MAAAMEELRIPIFTEKRDMKDFARRHSMAGKRVGLVGTMGAVHAGESPHGGILRQNLSCANSLYVAITTALSSSDPGAL